MIFLLPATNKINKVYGKINVIYPKQTSCKKMLPHATQTNGYLE